MINPKNFRQVNAYFRVLANALAAAPADRTPEESQAIIDRLAEQCQGSTEPSQNG